MKKQPSPLLLNNQLCFQLYTATRFMIKAYQPLLKPLDITYPQYLVLLVLWEEDGLSVGDIGAALYLDSGTLSPLIKRLLAKGLIAKQRDANDERTVRVQLTARGRKLEQKAYCIPDEIAAAASIAPRDAEHMFATLLRFNHSISADAEGED